MYNLLFYGVWKRFRTILATASFSFPVFLSETPPNAIKRNKTQDKTIQPLRITLLQLNSILKWDHFEIVATWRSDIYCTIKKSLLIKDSKPLILRMYVEAYETLSH